jgi:very-short-patch-repair endonuclease
VIRFKNENIELRIYRVIKLINKYLTENLPPSQPSPTGEGAEG